MAKIQKDTGVTDSTSKTISWTSLPPDERKFELFRRQKVLLDTFLSSGAISQAQHDKSLNCLIEKMGIKDAAGIK